MIAIVELNELDYQLEELTLPYLGVELFVFERAW
jgi:hypothetical protein